MRDDLNVNPQLYTVKDGLFINSVDVYRADRLWQINNGKKMDRERTQGYDLSAYGIAQFHSG
jgi:hypothetical protein